MIGLFCSSPISPPAPVNVTPPEATSNQQSPAVRVLRTGLLVLWRSRSVCFGQFAGDCQRYATAPLALVLAFFFHPGDEWLGHPPASHDSFATLFSWSRSRFHCMESNSIKFLIDSLCNQHSERTAFREPLSLWALAVPPNVRWSMQILVSYTMCAPQTLWFGGSVFRRSVW